MEIRFDGKRALVTGAGRGMYTQGYMLLVKLRRFQRYNSVSIKKKIL